MNNLRDKLLKAGLVTSDAVKRVEAEARQKNKAPEDRYEDTCKRARQFDEDLIKAERVAEDTAE